jgi:hypothetical protein
MRVVSMRTWNSTVKKTAPDDGPGVRLDPGHHGRVMKRRAFGPLDQDEIGDHGQGQAAPQPAVAPQPFLVIEGEQQAGGKLGQGAADKGDAHGQQDAGDDGQGLARVDVVRQVRSALVAVEDFDQRYGNGRPQQFENDRYGGRGRQTEGVEQIEQEDVGDHDGQKDGDQLGHHEKGGDGKMPLRATSIMPLEKVTPARMPRLATIMMTCAGAPPGSPPMNSEN